MCKGETFRLHLDAALSGSSWTLLLRRAPEAHTFFFPAAAVSGSSSVQTQVSQDCLFCPCRYLCRCLSLCRLTNKRGDLIAVVPMS